MKTEFHQLGDARIAEINSEDIIIRDVQDALDLMADCSYHGAGRIIIYEKNLLPVFFDLKTGLAGDILQKFSNYRVKLAIVGEFSEYDSKSLRDFIRESNKQRQVNFVRTKEEALHILGKS